jgi:hypothetical protein
MHVIPANREKNTGGSRFEASLDKKLVRPYVKNKPGVVINTVILSTQRWQ